MLTYVTCSYINSAALRKKGLEINKVCFVYTQKHFPRDTKQYFLYLFSIRVLQKRLFSFIILTCIYIYIVYNKLYGTKIRVFRM